jgi:hypothetical protein
MTAPLGRIRSLIAALGLSIDSGTERCSGCGATVPIVPGGPVHRSIGASPGCWALYTALLASEFTAFDARVHQLSVDTYAAQHPDQASPQSACAHLVALCLSLEHGFGVEDLRSLTGDLGNGRWFASRWLAPPSRPFALTTIDLLEATTPDDYARAVHRWARATWEAWRDQHAQVRAWADAVVGGNRARH